MMCGTGPALDACAMRSDLLNFLAGVRAEPEIWRRASNTMFQRSVL